MRNATSPEEQKQLKNLKFSYIHYNKFLIFNIRAFIQQKTTTIKIK